MLVHLVYTSSATRLQSQDELVDLLAVSRACNAADGLTGALVYCDGTFIQALEGPAAAVEATYARISRDARHHGATLLLRAETAERQFPDWAMGFRPVDRLPPDVDGFRSVFALTERGGGRAQRLLSVARALDPFAQP